MAPPRIYKSAVINNDFVVLQLPSSASAICVALKGATLYSWTTPDAEERLFLSSLSPIEADKPNAIRGGIPICWPIFGPPPKEAEANDSVTAGRWKGLKQHGFARNEIWKFEEEETECSREKGKLVFSLSPSPTIASLFPNTTSPPPAFRLTYTIIFTFSGTLTATLSVSNPSNFSSTVPPPVEISPAPANPPEGELKFQALLHAYIRLGKGMNTQKHAKVEGLKGKEYKDKAAGNVIKTEDRDLIKFEEGEVDRAYYGVEDEGVRVFYEPLGEGEEIEGGEVMETRVRRANKGGYKIEKWGFEDTVVWNPSPSKLMPDLSNAHEWICVEPGLAKDFKSLKPGESWEGGIRIRVIDDWGTERK